MKSQNTSPEKAGVKASAPSRQNSSENYKPHVKDDLTKSEWRELRMTGIVIRSSGQIIQTASCFHSNNEDRHKAKNERS